MPSSFLMFSLQERSLFKSCGFNKRKDTQELLCFSRWFPAFRRISMVISFFVSLCISNSFIVNIRVIVLFVLKRPLLKVRHAKRPLCKFRRSFSSADNYPYFFSQHNYAPSSTTDRPRSRTYMSLHLASEYFANTKAASHMIQHTSPTSFWHNVKDLQKLLISDFLLRTLSIFTRDLTSNSCN